jgi:response regulator RpfG family c-di-GMP phosphodiesterase
MKTLACNKNLSISGTTCEEDFPLIMCIDDDPDITWLVTKILADFEVRTISGEFVKEGIKNAVVEVPDLIITDLKMPEGGGEELLGSVKACELTQHIPVIVLTGLRDPQLPFRLRNMGARGYLQKPVHYKTLLAEIGKFVTLRERE